jgi:hypothetical protein
MIVLWEQLILTDSGKQLKKAANKYKIKNPLLNFNILKGDSF